MALTPAQIALTPRNPAILVDRILKTIDSMSPSEQGRARVIFQQFGLPLASPARMALAPRDILNAAYEFLVSDILDQTADQFQAADTEIQFIGDIADAYDPPASALTVDIVIGVTNAVNVINSFSKVPSVTVDITGGTATDPKVNGSAGPAIVVNLVDGQATITVTATSTGTVLLAMTDTAASGLDVSEAVTVTFS